MGATNFIYYYVGKHHVHGYSEKASKTNLKRLTIKN